MRKSAVRSGEMDFSDWDRSCSWFRFFPLRKQRETGISKIWKWWVKNIYYRMILYSDFIEPVLIGSSANKYIFPFFHCKKYSILSPILVPWNWSFRIVENNQRVRILPWHLPLLTCSTECQEATWLDSAREASYIGWRFSLFLLFVRLHAELPLRAANS